MTDEIDPRAADGERLPDETFESVNWGPIDQETQDRSFWGSIWLVVVSLWTLGVLYEIVSRFVLDSGPAVLPGIGAIEPETWLWALTLLFMFFYGVIPLYQNPRLTKHYWKQFRKNKAAVISGYFLSVVLVIGVVGSRVLPAATPNPGYERLPPFWMATEDYYTGNNCPGGTTTTPDDVTMCHGSMDFPLGTTASGEDILLYVVQGMEVSMMVGLTATLMSIMVATLVGLTAAYYGGLVDEGLMRYVDIQMTFPTFFLFILLAYTIGGSLFILIMIFGLFGWGATARIIRAEALQRRAEPYMMAAKSAGASSYWSIRKHLIPNTTNSIITAATLTIPGIILGEAALAFLGLADASIPSWGRVIADGRNYLGSSWWISTIPGLFLFCSILAFNFIGDALRDALDPRHGGAE